MRNLLGPLLGGLILCQMVYAGWLTSDLETVLSCAPAILVIVAVVGGLVVGVIFFNDVDVESEPDVALQASPIRRRRGRTASSDSVPGHDKFRMGF